MSRFLSIALLSIGLLPRISVATEPGRISVTSRPGTNYVGYSYPAFGSCPCMNDRCLLPGRYYAHCGEGDATYKKAFWKRWLRAHFCGGSMLDGVPCECSNPPPRWNVMLPPADLKLAPPPAPTSDLDESEPAPPPVDAVEDFPESL